MPFNIRLHGGLETIALKPLEEIRFDSLAGPVDIAGRDEFAVLLPVTKVAEDSRKQAQDASALLEILHSGQPLLRGVEQSRMERVALDDSLRVGLRRCMLDFRIFVLLGEPLVE
jgi:hypothetical protein